MAGVAITAHLTAENGRLDSLAELRWKHRIILVDEATEQTVSELVAHRAAIDERHIVWFAVVDGELRSNYHGALDGGLLQQLRKDHFDRMGLPVMLIGKDGGIKASNPSLDMGDYFAQIDSMRKWRVLPPTDSLLQACLSYRPRRCSSGRPYSQFK